MVTIPPSMNKVVAMSSYNKHKGFGLIEVMITLVVVGLGILAVSKLQAVFIKSTSNANTRTVAVSIAQKKIDDLRSFANLTTSSDDVPDTWVAGLASQFLAYKHIDDNEGGAPFGTTELTAGNIPGDNTTYNLSWQVDDYWYSADLSAATTTEPVPAPAVPDFKLVNVTVSWVDESNNNEFVSLQTIIDAYAPMLTAFSDETNNTGNVGPLANYTPLPAPDVVPVSIKADGTKFKETSVPEPEVTKQDYATVVEFETVTYNNLDIALRREDIVTAACSCAVQVSASDVVHTYGYLDWDAENEQFVDRTYDVVNNNNDVEQFAGADSIQECGICCRDGQYDVTEPDGSGVQTQPFGALGQLGAGIPDKVCRLKRIDGIYRVIKPWKLIAFNVIPASYFDPDQTDNYEANITTYSNYVESAVRSALTAVDEETDVAGTDYVVDTTFSDSAAVAGYADAGYSSVLVPGSDGLLDHDLIKQGSLVSDARSIQARAVYLDIPPDGYLTNASGVDYTNADVPLERIPFYETNVTGLVGWSPDEDQTVFDDLTPNIYTAEHDTALQGNSVRQACQSANITNPTIADAATSRICVSNQVLTNKTFGDYQRGDLYPYEVGTTSIEARMHTSIDGLVDQSINSEPFESSSVIITTIP